MKSPSSMLPVSFCADVSVRGREWRLRTPIASYNVPANISPMLTKIASGRGISDISGYFEGSFAKSMPNPSSFIDMDNLAERLAKAMSCNETIGIIGDYDVDGATSIAIMVRYLRMAGYHKVEWRIPHRIKDGYGPNTHIIDELIANDAKVILIMDSGTTAFDAINHAREKGIDILVVDHHEQKDVLPNCILVNPKRSDCDRSFDYLCTAGLAILVCNALQRTLHQIDWFKSHSMPDIRELLGLAALGTVADVVPLKGLNRDYVKFGMPRMNDIMGIRTLARIAGKTVNGEHKSVDYTPRTLGFVFGPAINAAGRLEDMTIGVQLLLTEDIKQAEFYAHQLTSLNDDRKGIQKTAVEDARLMVENNDLKSKQGVIVLASEQWHPGVVGLVAARLREFYDRPAVIIGNQGKGSARSVEGYDIGKAIIGATQAGLMQKGGGHMMAAGLTIDYDKVSALKDYMDETFKDHVFPPTDIDLAVMPGELTVAMVQSFALMEPFGMGNPEPVILLHGGYVRKIEILKNLHVKAYISAHQGDVIAMIFNGIDSPLGKALINAEGRFIDVVGKCDLNVYNGITKIFLKPDDIMVGSAIDGDNDR